jgi:hypothetical protein
VSIDLDPVPGGVAGWEGLAPGSVLVEALEGIDPTCLEGAESIAYLRGCARVRNASAARFLTAVHEAGRAEDGTTTRRGLVDEFSGDEVSTALGWSRSMAGRCLEFADDLHHARTPLGGRGPHPVDARHGRSSCRTRAVSRVRWSRSGTLVAVREASA